MLKRQSYTTSEKLKIIQFAEEHGNRAAQREFGIAESTVRLWRKSKENLQKMPRLRVLVINCYTEEYFVVFCAENVSVCGFNDNRNYNFFLESVLKNRVRIIYGCALYTGKYGIYTRIFNQFRNKS